MLALMAFLFLAGFVVTWVIAAFLILPKAFKSEPDKPEPINVRAGERIVK